MTSEDHFEEYADAWQCMALWIYPKYIINVETIISRWRTLAVDGVMFFHEAPSYYFAAEVISVARQGRAYERGALDSIAFGIMKLLDDEWQRGAGDSSHKPDLCSQLRNLLRSVELQ